MLGNESKIKATCPNCNQPMPVDGPCPICLLNLGLGAGQRVSHAYQGPVSMPSTLELAEKFPHLELEHMIGRGGMGAIYQAQQRSLGRTVALKLISQEFSSDSSFAERFEREAKTLAMLSHANIVTVFDYGRTEDGLAYLLMEYIDGVNLRDAILTRNFTPHETLELVTAICQALEYAHSKGVIHRDVKPENILLGKDGEIKVADFGIAKIIDRSQRHFPLTATRQVLGSPHYLAPEQIEAPDEVDHRIDLFALGVIFYELLTGQLPLGMFDPPSRIHPELDPRFDAIVLRLLQRKPSARYQSATELLAELKALPIENSSAVSEEYPPHHGRKNAVPFTVDTLGGFAEARGILQATATGLRVEYFVVDAVLGGIKSEVKNVEISKDQIIRVHLKHGVFHSKITIVADDFATVSQLPGGEEGELTIYVKRRDRELAENLVRALGFDTGQLSAVGDPSKESKYYPTLALMMIIFGILNGGFLATVMVAINVGSSPYSSMGLSYPEIFTVPVSIALGLLILAQMMGGLLHLFFAVESPWRLALIASLLPVTPVFLISAPVAVWYWWNQPGISNLGLPNFTTSRPSWTATTMLFLRENRTARLMSILNGIGIVGLIIAAVIFRAGWYPTSIRFRPVGLSADDRIESRQLLKNQIEGRLADLRGQTVRVPTGTHWVEVRTWKWHRPDVIQRLEITHAPRLVLLMTGHDTSPESPPSDLMELASGLDFTGAISLGAGAKVATLPGEFQLTESLVRAVQPHSAKSAGAESRLSIRWSQEGRSQFDSWIQQSSDSTHVGLVIDGIVEAIAELNESAGRQLDFALSPSLSKLQASLTAAIRGPDLIYPMELLD